MLWQRLLQKGERIQILIDFLCDLGPSERGATKARRASDIEQLSQTEKPSLLFEAICVSFLLCVVTLRHPFALVKEWMRLPIARTCQ